jgi:hypothetical protein
MTCDCKQWKHGMLQIHSAQILAHNHGMQYTGEQFKYCPWCRKELIKDND